MGCGRAKNDGGGWGLPYGRGGKVICTGTPPDGGADLPPGSWRETDGAGVVALTTLGDRLGPGPDATHANSAWNGPP